MSEEFHDCFTYDLPAFLLTIAGYVSKPHWHPELSRMVRDDIPDRNSSIESQSDCVPIMVKYSEVDNCFQVVYNKLVKAIFGDMPTKIRIEWENQSSVIYALESLPYIYLSLYMDEAHTPSTYTFDLLHQLCLAAVIIIDEDLYENHGPKYYEHLASFLLSPCGNRLLERLLSELPCCILKDSNRGTLDNVYYLQSASTFRSFPQHMKYKHFTEDSIFYMVEVIGHLLQSFGDKFPYYQVRLDYHLSTMVALMTKATHLTDEFNQIYLPTLKISYKRIMQENHETIRDCIYHQVRTLSENFPFTHHLANPNEVNNGEYDGENEVSRLFFDKLHLQKYFCCVKIHPTVDTSEQYEFFHYIQSFSEECNGKNELLEPIFSNFYQYRQDTAKQLIDSFNAHRFIDKDSGSTTSLQIHFMDHLTATAGLTIWKNTRHVTILLSHKIVCTPAKLRDVVLHQLCLANAKNEPETLYNHGWQYLDTMLSCQEKLPLKIDLFRQQDGCCNSLYITTDKETKFFLKSLVHKQRGRQHKEAKHYYEYRQTHEIALTETLMFLCKTHLFNEEFSHRTTQSIEIEVRWGDYIEKDKGFAGLTRSLDKGFPLVDGTLEGPKCFTNTIEMSRTFCTDIKHLVVTFIHELCHVMEKSLGNAIYEDHGRTWWKYIAHCRSALPFVTHSQYHTKHIAEYFVYGCRECSSLQTVSTLKKVSERKCLHCKNKAMMLVNVIQRNPEQTFRTHNAATHNAAEGWYDLLP